MLSMGPGACTCVRRTCELACFLFLTVGLDSCIGDIYSNTLYLGPLSFSTLLVNSSFTLS